MVIEIGKLYKNRTLTYLLPALRVYGSTFMDKFNGVSKLAVGIHDTLLDGTAFEQQRLMFILLDSYYRPDVYESFMNWIKHQEYYVMDYSFGPETNNRKHMLVIAFPEKLGDVYDKFLEGKYSKMYCFDEIEQFFPNDSDQKNVIIKSVSMRKLFMQKVNDRFGVVLEPSDLSGNSIEYDFPPEKEEEFFNYYK